MNKYIICRSVFDDLGYRQEDEYLIISNGVKWIKDRTTAEKLIAPNAQILLQQINDDNSFALKV